MITRRATLEDLDLLVPLFDGYMVFYRKPSDPEKHLTYLYERLHNEEAVIFLALNAQGEPAGFTLLYPTFSSVSMARIFTLNDLFVDRAHRKQGLASLLLQAAATYGKDQGAVRLHLETEDSNSPAQALYEREGWIKETNYFYYLQL